MKQITLFGVKPIESKPPIPLTSDKRELNKYAMLGLDVNKISQEAGQRTKVFFCVWDQVEVSRGFYLCFSHFVLSEKAAIRLLDETGTLNEENEKCCHCKQVAQYLHVCGGNGVFAICASCVNDAITYLSKPPHVPPGTQLTLL